MANLYQDTDVEGIFVLGASGAPAAADVGVVSDLTGLGVMKVDHSFSAESEEVVNYANDWLADITSKRRAQVKIEGQVWSHSAEIMTAKIGAAVNPTLITCVRAYNMRGHYGAAGTPPTAADNSFYRLADASSSSERGKANTVSLTLDFRKPPAATALAADYFD